MIFGVLIALAVVVNWRATRRENRAMADFAPEGQLIRIDGLQMHALVRGAGPDLVLIHGSSGSLRDFTFRLVDILAVRYRVIAIDRPGHGWSDPHPDGARLDVQARLLRATAAHFGAHRPIVMGQSYGGAVALAWALFTPNTVSGLVTVSAPSHPWQTGLGAYYTILSHWLGLRLAVPLLAAFVPDRVVQTAVRDIFAPQNAPDGFSAHFGPAMALRRKALRANALQRRRLLQDIIEMSGTYAQIKVPMVIVHGAVDTTVSPKIHAQRMIHDLPHAQLRLLPGIGHMPHHVAIDDVVTAIDDVAVQAGLRQGTK